MLLSVASGTKCVLSVRMGEYLGVHVCECVCVRVRMCERVGVQTRRRESRHSFMLTEPALQARPSDNLFFTFRTDPRES